MRPPSVLIFAAILAASGAALACPSYPAEVQTDLGLAYTPPCTICHTTVVGNASSATECFAQQLEMLGANLSCDLATLDSILKQLETDKTSVDPTGTPATTLLQEGCDPNTDAQIGTSSIDGGTCPGPIDAGACPGSMGDGGTETNVTVAYGCGAQIAGSPALWQGAVAIAVLGLALARRRRVAKG